MSTESSGAVKESAEKASIKRHILSILTAEQRESMWHLLNRWRHPVCTGHLRRLAPVSRWGWDRGQPIDRYYIEQYLSQHSSEIKGHTLEVKDASYTTRFGKDVTRSDVLDIDPTNPSANVIADLTAADHIPSNMYDSFILTQTLQFIYNIEEAVRHAHRILRPGGVLLVTVPGFIRIDGLEHDYWRFTPASCKRLFGQFFDSADVTVETRGNCLAVVSFLIGVASAELKASDLQRVDPEFPLTICIRACKNQPS